jgi:hypothetical protein
MVQIVLGEGDDVTVNGDLHNPCTIVIRFEELFRTLSPLQKQTITLAFAGWYVPRERSRRIRLGGNIIHVHGIATLELKGSVHRSQPVFISVFIDLLETLQILLGGRGHQQEMKIVIDCLKLNILLSGTADEWDELQQTINTCLLPYANGISHVFVGPTHPQCKATKEEANSFYMALAECHFKGTVYFLEDEQTKLNETTVTALCRTASFVEIRTQNGIPSSLRSALFSRNTKLTVCLNQNDGSNDGTNDAAFYEDVNMMLRNGLGAKKLEVRAPLRTSQLISLVGAAAASPSTRAIETLSVNYMKKEPQQAELPCDWNEWISICASLLHLKFVSFKQPDGRPETNNAFANMLLLYTRLNFAGRKSLYQRTASPRQLGEVLTTLLYYTHRVTDGSVYNEDLSCVYLLLRGYPALIRSSMTGETARESRRHKRNRLA